MRISATFDHRFIDGTHAAQLARTMEEIFADPAGTLDKTS
jgi:pyruvate dehydrogenase E2 component (dihydrolipoamide acetyltransferase)